METERSHCGASSANGQLFVFGGGGLNFKSLQTVEVYDPQEDRWTFSTPMPTLRSGLVSVVLNHQIYVMGGGFKNPDGTFNFMTVVELFDPVRHSWEKGPSLKTKHDAPSATFYHDTIYLFGGHHPEAAGGPLTDPAFAFSEKLDLRLQEWKEIAPLPTPRFSLGTVSIGNKIWAMGGGAFRDNRFQNFDLIEIFDPEKGTWEQNLPVRLPWPSAGIGACALNNRIYVFGGNDGTRISSRAAVYDLAGKKWEELEPMPEPRAAPSVTVLNGMIYLVGGRDASGKIPTNTLMAFHPS
ncbi:MAG: Kelch repeat-containing protein [Nitrospiria bacterium]